MIESRILRRCYVDHFTEPSGMGAIRDRLCQQTIIEENRTRTRKLQSLVQRLKCPSPVAKPKTPVKEESRYEEIVYPPVTYHGHCSEMFPEKVEPPPQDVFMCAKTYRNKRTQVRKPETFDFEAEVQPYLEILVGTSVKAAMDEANNEYEMVFAEASRHDFRARVKVERAERTRLEKADGRLLEEKANRNEQFPEGCRQLMERASAADPLVLVKGFDGDLVANALEGFHPRPYRTDVIKSELEGTLRPVILDKMAATTTKVMARGILTEMVRDINVNVAQGHDDKDETRSCSVLSCSSNEEDGVLKYDEEWQIVEMEEERSTSDESEIMTEIDSTFHRRMSKISSTPPSLASRRRTIVKDSSLDRRRMLGNNELIVPSTSPRKKDSATSLVSSADSWAAVIYDYET